MRHRKTALILLRERSEKLASRLDMTKELLEKERRWSAHLLDHNSKLINQKIMAKQA